MRAAVTERLGVPPVHREAGGKEGEGNGNCETGYATCALRGWGEDGEGKGN